MSVTFPVSVTEDSPRAKSLRNQLVSARRSPPAALHTMFLAPRHLVVEAQSKALVLDSSRTGHALIDALTVAFSLHAPLTLSPDHIWLTLLQGVGLHVEQNPEEHREFFVRHQGQQEISVRRDEFLRGDPNNDWGGCIQEFADKTAAYLTHDAAAMCLPNFSTTTDIDRVAASATFLGVVRHYFTYGIQTLCGIPEITLLGTPQDWRSLRDQAELFQLVPGLKPWCETLIPVLNQFVAAFDRPKTSFWRSFFSHNSASGGDRVWGHVLKLFPYFSTETVFRNELAWGSPGPEQAGDDVFPRSLSMAPFTWQYLGNGYDMRLIAGLVGFDYSKEKGVHPVSGWIVAENQAP